MSESQQKALLSEGVSRHVWERCPLAGHSVFFMTRAWEIGRMTGYVKNYSSIEDKEAFQKELRRNTLYGWLIETFQNHVDQWTIHLKQTIGVLLKKKSL